MDAKPPYQAVLAEIESFSDDRKGYSTLLVLCESGKRVQFRVKTTQIKNMNVDSIYDLLDKECKSGKNEYR